MGFFLLYIDAKFGQTLIDQMCNFYIIYFEQILHLPSIRRVILKTDSPPYPVYYIRFPLGNSDRKINPFFHLSTSVSSL